MPQDDPGEGYLDLRDIIKRYEAEMDVDGQEQDEEYLAQCEGLFAQYGDYEAASRNEPTLIRDSEFVDYAMEFAYGIGAASRDAGWPRIDWDAAADDLKMDYTEVTFGGYEYLTRGA